MEMITIDVPGFSSIVEKIRKNSVILLSGGAGTGKTNFILQSFYNAALKKERCIFITLEETEESIRRNCESFGWKFRDLEKKGDLIIKSVNPMEISREVEAAELKKKGELLVKTKGVLGIIPKNFKPDRICIDSVTSLYAAFTGKEEKYRFYFMELIENLKRTNATIFLISEMEQELEKYSKSGVEEFLADGVIVFYNVRKGSSRQRALEVLKLRGIPHLNRIIPFNITGKGIEIRSEERIFE